MKGIKIEEIDGDFNVNFNEHEVDYNVNELSMSVLTTIEIASVEAVASHLFDHIINTPLVRVLIEKYKYINMNQIECVSDYNENMKEVQKAVSNFTKTAEKGAELLEINDDLFLTLFRNDARNAYKEVNTMVNKLMPMFENSAKVENVCYEELSKEEFLRIVSGLNNKILSSLKATNKFVENSEGLFLGDPCIYSTIADSFEKIIKKMDSKYLERDEIDYMIKDMKKIPASLKSESEVQREMYINKANDLYNQLCMDWMRDLKNQAPFSVKERYNSYIAKFNKFNERFQMPLAPTTSLGKAKEVCSQINNMMDYISSISNESYSISPYNER